MDFRVMDVGEDTLGIELTDGICTFKKDHRNLVGISIGGGAPYCPCLYVVQVFDDSPAAREGSLSAGDEIISVDNKVVKGCSRAETAKLIQSLKENVTIKYRKLLVDENQGKTMDIILKKMKHRIVESINSETADLLGLSRAILCNDVLLKELQNIDDLQRFYKDLILYTQRLKKATNFLARTHKAFGDTFANIGAREPQQSASKAFTQFGDAHRQLNKIETRLATSLDTIIDDLRIFLCKVIPDMKCTIAKYADAKFEYLSYCLKVKEMDDEETAYASVKEALYRVETGNYEYRLILRCRQLARNRFSKRRNDVLEKLKLLENKHTQDIASQVKRVMKLFVDCYSECEETLRQIDIFPIEVDLTDSILHLTDFSDNSEEEPETNDTAKELLNIDDDLIIP